MKKRTLIAGAIALLSLATVSLTAAEQMTTYVARPGSKMRIEGTANAIHTTWLIESPLIGGMIEVGPGFPTEPGQAVTPGKVEAKGNAFIRVSSLKSVESDGKPYSDKMDEITYEHLKEEQFKQINYKLTELTLKEAPKSKDAPYVFDAKGDLTVAGVTKKGFRIWIIPHTYEVTALSERKVGDAVNLEADLLGKYVEKFLALRTAA